MAQARKYSAVRSLPDARAVDSFLCDDDYLSLTESARAPDGSRIRNPAPKADAAWGLRLATWKPEDKGNLCSVAPLSTFALARPTTVPRCLHTPPEQEQALRAMAAQLRQMKKSSTDDGWVRIMEQKNLAPNAAAKVSIKEKARIDTALREHGLLLTDT